MLSFCTEHDSDKDVFCAKFQLDLALKFELSWSWNNEF